jgi:SAM-dependent methyltransferase
MRLKLKRAGNAGACARGEEAGGAYSELAALWPDFVAARWEGEHGRFVLSVLSQNGCRDVFNASLGEGSDTARLLESGFRVTSNEIDASLAKVARQTSLRAFPGARVTGLDWRELPEKMPAESFDAVVLLGNSLTHLRSRADRLKALEGFLHVLRPGGILVIDERNYQPALDDEAGFRGRELPRSKTYPGQKVRVRCESVSPREIIISYAHENGAKGQIAVYPFRRGELRAEIGAAGFGKPSEFSDYAQGYRRGCEFVEYVAKKPGGASGRAQPPPALKS